MRLKPPTLRSLITVVFATIMLAASSSIATAGPILLSFDVVLMQPGPIVDTDSNVAVGGGVEINYASGTTNVGALFFDDEFIDVTSSAAATTLVYQIQGGLNPHPVVAGYSTSWPFGSAIMFYNFVLDQPATLASVDVDVDGVIGAAGGPLVYPDFLVGPNFLQLNFGQFGILEQANQTPLGLMTFQLNFVADEEPPNPVPDPASSWALLGLSMSAIAAGKRLAGRRP